MAVISMKPPPVIVTVNVTLSPDDLALVRRFLSVNQHATKNSHGPMTLDKLGTMLFEDIAAMMRDGDSWQGAHMSLVASEHGYRAG
jgi:hypothetical protein